MQRRSRLLRLLVLFVIALGLRFVTRKPSPPAKLAPPSLGIPAQNPSVVDASGAWEYGYSAGRSLSPDEFRIDTVIDPGQPVRFWHPSRIDHNGDGDYPYVALNTGSQTDGKGGWAIRPGAFAMEGSASGQYSIVRFMPRAAGTYHIEAAFEGIHFGLSTTDVHVLHASREVFAADIDGYGGDAAFHPVVGANPSASYSGDLDLRDGDRVTFAVGVGRNGSNTCDTTGLSVKITPGRPTSRPIPGPS